MCMYFITFYYNLLQSPFICQLKLYRKFCRICYRRSVHIYQTTRCHMTEYSHINIKYGFKTKYYTGHNISFQMTPTVGGGDGYSCTTASCAVDLNPGCPKDLKVWDGGNVVACKCSCLAYSTDEYCCRGAFNDPNVCKGGPSAVYFKSKCPGANSYAHDDRTTTCQNTDYNIKFGQLVIEHICFL